jgi:hypothetical protein
VLLLAPVDGDPGQGERGGGDVLLALRLQGARAVHGQVSCLEIAPLLKRLRRVEGGLHGPQDTGLDLR